MADLVFEPVERSRHQLTLRYRFDDLRFTTTYWYDTVDLVELDDRYGADFMRSVWFHLLAFEANKAASLGPDRIDFGPWADLVTDAFWDLWETIFRNVWGVWRFENDLPDFRLPRPLGAGDPTRVEPQVIEPGPTPLLMLCGGGKDSLVSMKLLERGGIDYEAFVYSHSTYGRGDHQHALIDGLLAHCRPRRLHRGWVLDDAIDSPATVVHPELGIHRMIAAETVSSYWTSLPVALAHGHTEVALGITRSTDEHNLAWDRNGEQINYLWGMSSHAEQLLHDYLRAELLANVSVFHILRPIYDVNVFTLLGRDLDAVPATHSCAQVKPWCGRCAKCIYVWMNYAAWLPESTMADTFEIRPLDVTENRTMLRRMLGLESYKPTDCVGTVSEARLAFAMCRARGVSGALVDEIGDDAFIDELPGIVEHYSRPSPAGTTFPPRLATVIEPQLATSADTARRRISEILGW